ncbi:hypothetical protein [Tenacibaculum aiptasiae]|uniref:hypothetical protein n=1 Tax=Tenacibaculum aiptasiae TaxID=426481 RepID=UPI00232DE34D|nr:hypothetical protein [Tenacibaculum aiptasiae]
MNTFILKTGKGKYGIGGKQIQGVDLLNISQDPTALVNALISESFSNLPDLSILNSITPESIKKWNEEQFTEAEVKKLKTLISWRNVLLPFKLLLDKTSIPALNTSNIVALKNYNDGSVSGNYLLVYKKVSSSNVNWKYLKDSTKIGVHYYDEANQVPDSFVLEKTTEIKVDDYVVYKVTGATSNARFSTFFPNQEGFHSRNVYVYSLENSPLVNSDFYKEGTFTPELKVAGDSATHSITTLKAEYERFGNTVNFRILMSGISTQGIPTGSLDIVGMPFPCDYNDAVSIGAFRGSNIPSADVARIKAYVVGNSIQFRSVDVTVDTFTNTIFTNGMILVSGSYKTNVYTF